MSKTGIGGGLTNDGDQVLSLYLRRFFAHAMGLSEKLLRGPVAGIDPGPADGCDFLTGSR
jgi:hypothetical protein